MKLGRNLASILDRATRHYPRRRAVIDGEVTQTWEEMEDRVGRLAGALASMGVRAGDRVAVLSYNSHRYYELYWAIPRLGAIIVPLNYRLAPAELEFCLSDSGAKAVFVGEGLHIPPGYRCDFVFAEEEYEELIHDAQWVAPAGCDEDAVAGIFYTGGTTGRPKGVALTHRNLCEGALNVINAMRFVADDVYLHAGPMFHLADGCGSLATTWLGAVQVFIPSFSPDRVLDAIEAHGVTTVTLVPTMWSMLLDHPAYSPEKLSSLRVSFYSASPMPEDLLRRVMAEVPGKIGQGYGMTETAARLTSLTPEDHVAAASGEMPAARLRSAGREIVGVEVRVVDESGRESRVGEVGEIVARGPNVMKGYWGDEDETRRVLKDGWMHTGDLAYRDGDGYVFVVDRSKDMIITGGENVYTTEVENALFSHPDVAEAAVVGVPDEKWGERVHAVVVRAAGSLVTEAELVAHCRTKIAGYKIPRSIEFREEIPKSGAGKILKRLVRERAG